LSSEYLSCHSRALETGVAAQDVRIRSCRLGNVHTCIGLFHEAQQDKRTRNLIAANFLERNIRAERKDRELARTMVSCIGFRETDDIAWRFTVQKVFSGKAWGMNVDNNVPKIIEIAKTAPMNTMVM
jgi:hypothetical protein